MDILFKTDSESKAPCKQEHCKYKEKSLNKKVLNKIGKKYLGALKNGILLPWQVSLRKEIHIEDIKMCFQPSSDLLKKYPDFFESPEGAPIWAGGKGLKYSKKEPKLWEDHEIEQITYGFKSKTLLPWEACILYCQPSQRIIKILLSNNNKPKDIEPSPNYIPAWAQYNDKGVKRKKISKNPPQPSQIIPPPLQKEFDFNNTKSNTNTNVTTRLPSNLAKNSNKIADTTTELDKLTQKLPKHKVKTSKWTKKDKENLSHYWKLELLGSREVAALMERCPLKVVEVAKQLKLPKKHEISLEDWCGIKWEFTPEGNGDPRHLNPNLQRLVAEASATRFSLLYETVQSIKEDDTKYRKIQRELNQILELHSRIFSKYLLTRSRKYKFLGTSAWQVQKDLEQAGQTAIFECLRRWHPNRNIRFSRGTVNIAINREMLAWLEQQRLVELPDKIRSVARKLKQAHDRGTWDKEVDRLKKEAGENCVKEASKHQNTYAYLHTVPLMESYDEAEAEHGGVTGGTAECVENFSAVCLPQSDTDVCSLLIDACSEIPCAERRAVLAYHGINEDGTHGPQQTLEEIGAREGVTKERIRQRILKAKQRMRRWLERKNIKNVYDALSHA